VKYVNSGIAFREPNTWDMFFKPTDCPNMNIIRKASQIKNVNNLYSFKHKSFQEYYVAEFFYIEIMEKINLL